MRIHIRLTRRFRFQLTFLFVLAALHAYAQQGQAQDLQPIPINIAEAIIEPFWVPELSGLPQWRIDPGRDHGLQITQNWAAVDFEWVSKPKTGPALRMSRDFHVDCSRYDRLVVRLAPSKGSVLCVTAQTDKGQRSFVSKPANEKRAEYALDLNGAQCIDSLTLEITPGDDGPAAGWLRWIGLQSTERLTDYFARWDCSGKQWDAYIRPADSDLDFEPRYGIFLTSEELAERRQQHQQAMRDRGKSEYTQRVTAARDYEPEKGIHEFVDSGGTSTSSTATSSPISTRAACMPTWFSNANGLGSNPTPIWPTTTRSTISKPSSSPTAATWKAPAISVPRRERTTRS